MISFYYRAKKDPRTVVEGRIEAENRDAAITKLTRQGLFPTLVVPESEKAPRRFSLRLPSKKPTLKDRAHFSSELYNLLSGGVPLLRGLDILSGEAVSPPMKTVLASLQSDVREGRGFSEALANFSDWFGEFYVNLVKAGEASGGLETVLNNLAQYLEKEIEIRNRFFQAVAYPIFVLAFGVLTIVIMLVGIIPKLSELYSGMGASLPFLTRLVMGLSQGVLDYWWLAIIAIMSLVLFLKGLARKGSVVFIDRWSLQMPLFGEIHQKDEVGRIARALGMLLQNGIPVVESLKMITSLLRNRLLQEGMARIQSEVSQGKSLSQAMVAVGWFTHGATHLVLVGEESGRLEQAFQKLSEIYEKEIDQKMRLLTSLLEPALIVLIGGLVGIVVIAMLLPIFQMSLLTQ